jgi:hypothetical protein
MKHKHANNVTKPNFNCTLSISKITMLKFKNVVPLDIIIHHKKHAHVFLNVNNSI